MNKIVAINSDSQANPANFTVVAPPFKLAPYSQVCMTHFEGKIRDNVTINDTNDTLYWGTGTGYKSSAGAFGIMPVEVKLPHGTYDTDDTGTNQGHIVDVLEQALNETGPIIYRDGWEVSNLAAGVATITLQQVLAVRASGKYDIASGFKQLNIPGFYSTSASGWSYNTSVIATGDSNEITSGVNARGFVSNKEISFLVSDGHTGGTAQGGIEWSWVVPTSIDPLNSINGYYGIVDADSITGDAETNSNFWRTDRHALRGTRHMVDTDGVAVPDALKPEINTGDINMYFQAGFYVGNDGVVYMTVLSSGGEMTYRKTSLTLATDGANDINHRFSLRWFFDTDRYKCNLLHSGEQDGQPFNFAVLDTYSLHTKELNIEYKAFAIDATADGENEFQINGDYYDPADGKGDSGTDTNLELQIYWNRLTPGEIEENAMTEPPYLGITNQANFSNTWHVDPLRYSENHNENIAVTTTSQSAGVTTGNLGNSPQQKLFLINCPSLTAQGLICNPTSRNIVSTIGVFHSDYVKAIQYENWISLDNPVELSVSNMNFYISDTYGKPVSDFENSVSFLLKFRRDPLKARMAMMREQQFINSQNSRNMSKSNVVLDQVFE